MRTRPTSAPSAPPSARRATRSISTTTGTWMRPTSGNSGRVSGSHFEPAPSAVQLSIKFLVPRLDAGGDVFGVGRAGGAVGPAVAAAALAALRVALPAAVAIGVRRAALQLVAEAG